MAISVSSRLEFERLCLRRAFIDEASLVRYCVEFIQATTSLLLTPEHNHDDLPGNKRLDVVARVREQSPLALALEAKWLRSDGGSRNWSFEIAEDVLRLERISEEKSANRKGTCCRRDQPDY